MNNTDFDKQIWETIINFYRKYFSADKWKEQRQKNQLEAYWCRSDEEKQNLFQDPLQRIFARMIKSYQNTTWHQIQLSPGKNVKNDIGKGQRRVLITDPWFEDENIIDKVESEIRDNLDFKGKGNFVDFCKVALDIAKGLGKFNLSNYSFEQVQTANFEVLKSVVSKIFNEKIDKLKVSVFEKIFYETLGEPYQTIMKMQKMLPGLGIALTCDFLKESHLCNIAKPDVHICHVFSVIDGIPYSMDLALVKRIIEFANNVYPADKNDFCSTGAYHVDKVIWMICSDYITDSDKEKNKLKKEFLKTLSDEKANIISRSQTDK